MSENPPVQGVNGSPLTPPMSFVQPAEEVKKAGSIHSSGSTHKTRPLQDHGHEPVDLLPEGNLDPVYQAKARVLNDAIQDIGAT